MAGARQALGGALAMGALMTFGDWVWAVFVPAHRVVYGLLHGLALCAAIGAFLTWRAGRVAAGAAWGGGTGLAAAVGFYALAPLLGWAAMFPAWMAFWIAFAWIERRFVSRNRTAREALARGAVAAVASGLAFYAVSGMWTRPDPAGPDYAWALLAWTFAFLPGFAALLVSRPAGVAVK
jgi:hypothetical protein